MAMRTHASACTQSRADVKVEVAAVVRWSYPAQAPPPPPFPRGQLLGWLLWRKPRMLFSPCLYVPPFDDRTLAWRRMLLPRLSRLYMVLPGIIFSMLGRPAAAVSAMCTHTARLRFSHGDTWRSYALPVLPRSSSSAVLRSSPPRRCCSGGCMSRNASAARCGADIRAQRRAQVRRAPQPWSFSHLIMASSCLVSAATFSAMNLDQNSSNDSGSSEHT